MRWKSFALIIACTMLMVGSASAQGIVIPGDSDGDKIVSAEEVAAAEKLAQEGKLSADELQEIKHIHEKYPINITDSANRSLTIYKPVKTIISLPSWSYEPIFILDGLDKVAGVTNTAQETYPWIPEMAIKPTVGKYNDIDYEKVIELRPDLVIAGNPKKVNVSEEKLNPAGIPFVVLPFNNQNDFEKELKTLACILEKEERMDEFLSWRQGYVEQIAERVNAIKPEERAKVYGESNGHAFWAATNASGFHKAIAMAGGDNIAANLAGQPYYIDVDPEWVLNENPAVVVIAATMSDQVPGPDLNYNAPANATEGLEKYLEEVRNRTGLKGPNAAKDRRVYLLYGYCTEAVTRSFIGAHYMAKWFYPEQFDDMDPDAIHKEYFEKWMGLPYKGIWAYPVAS
jgi:iron complex transport system substrate-binding protein